MRYRVRPKFEFYRKSLLMYTLCTGVYDEQDNDKGTISRFFVRHVR